MASAPLRLASLAWLARACRPGLACAVALTLSAGCAAATAASQAAAPACHLTPAMTLTGIGGFTPTVRSDRAPLPGSHGMKGHIRWDVAQYVCGLSHGYVSDVLMHGKYRAQNNALARRLGYRVGRLPLLPATGPVVSSLPHTVLEAYEEVFQFRSATAARDWLWGARWTPTAPDDLPGLALPAGFIARAGVSGPDDGQHEHGIGISGLAGNSVVVVSFNGGRKLSWPDVRAIWGQAYHRLGRYLTLAHQT
jgi:hypothetical protein